jgi:hypothetical protein
MVKLLMKLLKNLLNLPLGQASQLLDLLFEAFHAPKQVKCEQITEMFPLGHRPT